MESLIILIRHLDTRQHPTIGRTVVTVVEQADIPVLPDMVEES